MAGCGITFAEWETCDLWNFITEIRLPVCNNKNAQRLHAVFDINMSLN